MERIHTKNLTMKVIIERKWPSEYSGYVQLLHAKARSIQSVARRQTASYTIRPCAKGSESDTLNETSLYLT